MIHLISITAQKSIVETTGFCRIHPRFWAKNKNDEIYLQNL